MKGERKRKKYGFQKGNQLGGPSPKKVKVEKECHNVHSFQRLTKSEMKKVVNKPYTLHRSTSDEITGSTPLNICLLRPRKDDESKVDENLQVDDKMM